MGWVTAVVTAVLPLAIVALVAIGLVALVNRADKRLPADRVRISARWVVVGTLSRIAVLIGVVSLIAGIQRLSTSQGAALAVTWSMLGLGALFITAGVAGVVTTNRKARDRRRRRF